MLILWLLLWTLGFIVYWINSRVEAMRWCSYIAFTTGCGGLAVVLVEWLLPAIESPESPEIALMLRGLGGLCSSIAHYFGPYTICIFGLLYSGVLPKLNKFYIKGILLLPIGVMYVLYPIYPLFLPDFTILTSWASIYILTGVILIIVSVFTARNEIILKQRLFACVVIVPPVLQALLTNFIFRAFQLDNLWRYNTIAIILQFIAFIYIGAKYGILGVRFKVEQDRMTHSMKVFTSGTAILNHSIKNELVKISMSMDYIKSNMKDISDNVRSSFDVVSSSIGHLEQMTLRIHEQMQDIVLVKTRTSLVQIINDSIRLQKPVIKQFQVSIQTVFHTEGYLFCDSVHLHEVLNNLIKNAVESIPFDREGVIAVSLIKKRNKYILSFQDNGIGISQDNLKHILDPFFTTKNRFSNYGLGLSYCYNVMMKSGGKMRIESTPGEGTIVYLYFTCDKGESYEGA